MAVPPIGGGGGRHRPGLRDRLRQVKGREPRSAVEVTVRLPGAGHAGRVAGLDHARRRRAAILARAWRSFRVPDSDRRWFLPGEMGGFAWPWVWRLPGGHPAADLLLSYIPYLQLGHGIAIPELGPGYGWSLDELQSQMFSYHFGLQAGHPAASPWWSWPLDLKPVWFYSPSWLRRPGVGHLQRRQPGPLLGRRTRHLSPAGSSPGAGAPLALVLIVAAFAFQLLPWTRIERATFQYHYLTAVLFAMIAIAYVVDEALQTAPTRPWRWPSSWRRWWRATHLAFGICVAMPDWYINAARALPPWNYAFQFPDRHRAPGRC